MKLFKGETHHATLETVTQMRMDNDAVKAFLGPAKCEELKKELSYNMLKTDRVRGDKPKFEMPNLANATPTFLIDELGKVREQIKILEKYEGLFKEALLARIKKDAAETKEGQT